ASPPALACRMPSRVSPVPVQSNRSPRLTALAHSPRPDVAACPTAPAATRLLCPAAARSPENSAPSPESSPSCALPSARKIRRLDSLPGFPHRAVPDTSVAPRPLLSNESTSAFLHLSTASLAANNPQKYPYPAIPPSACRNPGDAPRSFQASAFASFPRAPPSAATKSTDATRESPASFLQALCASWKVKRQSANR